MHPRPLIKCNQCGRRQAVCTPVVYVPIRNWPVPLYLQYKGALCDQCACAFNINKFTDWNGSWYDMACDHLRSIRKPAVNPFPDDKDFSWEEFIIKPDWEPAPKEECTLHFWRLETLAAKGAHVDISAGLRGNVRLT